MNYFDFQFSMFILCLLFYSMFVGVAGASELEECVFSLKEMNQYFAGSGFKHSIDYKDEWFSYDTGQYFVLDKPRNRIYSYFVGYGRIGVLDANGKASLIEIPFNVPISRAVAVAIDRDSGSWGSIFFHEDKVVSKKMGELNSLPEELFPTSDVNGKYLLRQYKEANNFKFQIATANTLTAQAVEDISANFRVEYAESTDNELYILLREYGKIPSFKLLVYGQDTWALLRSYKVKLPRTLSNNGEIKAVTLDIENKNIIAFRHVDGLFSKNTLLKLSFLDGAVKQFELRSGGVGEYIYFKMLPGACKKNYLKTKGTVIVD